YPPQEAVDELWRANNLWNTLVALHRESRENWDDARRAASIAYSEKMDALEKKQAEISQAFDALQQVRMEEGTKDESNPKLKLQRDVINRLKKEQGVIFDELKPLRKDADKVLDTKQLNDDFRKKVNTAASVKNNGLYNPTADEVVRNFKEARQKVLSNPAKSKLNIHSFDGTGYFNFRFRRKGEKQDGVWFSELFAGNSKEDRRFAILSKDESRKKIRLRLRVIMAGGATKASKVYQEFDWIYHRPIPEDAQIQNGKILRTRAGDKFRYDLVLTLRLPDIDKIAPNDLDGTIGIDIGFRKSGDTVLIATVMSDEVSSKPQEIKAPTEMVSALEHVINLQSELDDAATDLGRTITPLLKANPPPQDHQKYRLWKSIAQRPSNETLSYEKAYKFAIWLNNEPDTFPKEITEKVHTWWRSYSRKYREIHNRRRKQLTHRKHFYREAAASIVAQRKLIVLEKIPLNKFAETKDKDTKLNNRARAQRFLASLSEFREAIKNAADREGVPCIEVNPAYTSKTCSDCGSLNKALKAEKKWTCPSCGVVHDRDTNAANKLQKMGQIYIDDEKNDQ
ncbi:MAG: zinc ribbon domain-containing protein, partial [Proteobacteria bacterium]|nr:zinc ribbon domain-containing protein [Pseudomonadota bacterium]